MTPQEIIDRHEYGTYLDGLVDALSMTKPEIRNAIKVLREAE